MHGTFMGTIHLSRNLADAHALYIASIRGAWSIAQPVLSLQQSVNKYFSHKSDVLPLLCIVLIREYGVPEVELLYREIYLFCVAAPSGVCCTRNCTDDFAGKCNQIVKLRGILLA